MENVTTPSSLSQARRPRKPSRRPPLTPAHSVNPRRRAKPSMRGSVSSAAAADFARGHAPAGARTPLVLRAGAGGDCPPPNAVGLRCEADATRYAQPSIRDRRHRRRRHLTGIRGTPPFNSSTVVLRGRRRASLRGRPGVVAPARRRSTAGSLVVASGPPRGNGPRWFPVRRPPPIGTASSRGASRRARTTASSPPPRSPASHRSAS